MEPRLMLDAHGMPGAHMDPTGLETAMLAVQTTEYAVAAAPMASATTPHGEQEATSLPSPLRAPGDGPGVAEQSHVFGATYRDTSEFMLGTVFVRVVAFESDGSIDPNTENWGQNLLIEVEREIREGLKWWEDTFAARGLTTELEFIPDFTYLHEPILTGHELISHPNTEISLGVNDFLATVGFARTPDHSNDLRLHLHDQRLENNTDWAMTIFVVNSENDLDGQFAVGDEGTLYAWAELGGPYFVMTTDNGIWGIENMPLVTAHETAHVFYALDEYSTSFTTYESRSGYLNVQNLNAMKDHPNPESRVDSIMGEREEEIRAWNHHQMSPSGADMLKWRDTDGDGVPDGLDVPLLLSGQGSFDSRTGIYTFVGTSSVQALENQNPQNPWRQPHDITINSVDRAEYRLDDGAWTTIQSYGTQHATLDFSIIVPRGTHALDIRTVDADTGVTSNIFSDTVVSDGVKRNALFVAVQQPDVPGQQSYLAVLDLITGAILDRIHVPAFDLGVVTDVEVTPDDQIVVGIDITALNDGLGSMGGYVVIDPQGNQVLYVDAPLDGTNAGASPSGLYVDQRTGGIFVVQPANGKVTRYDRNHDAVHTYSAGSLPRDVLTYDGSVIYVSQDPSNLMSWGPTTQSYWVTVPDADEIRRVDAGGRTQQTIAVNDPYDVEEYEGTIYATSHEARSVTIISPTGERIVQSLIGKPAGLAAGAYYSTITDPSARIAVKHYMTQISNDGPTAVDFTTHQQGHRAPKRTIDIRNEGNANLVLSDIHVNSGPFTILSSSKTPLAPGESDSLVVQMSTDIRGELTGEIRLATNDPEEPQFAIPLAGNVDGPEINVRRDDGSEIVDGATDPIYFGRIEEGESGSYMEFFVRNDGELPLHIHDISVPEGFVITSAPSSIEVGKTGLLAVTMSGEGTGDKSGDIVIVSDDADEREFSFAVHGEVIPKAPVTGAITGQLFVDVNGNGIKDTLPDEEPALVGWTVFVDRDNDAILDNGEPAAITDADGIYRFDLLTPGPHTLNVVSKDGYQQTYPRNVDKTAIAYFPFDRTTDHVLDKFRRSAATLEGGASFASGKVGDALRFNGDGSVRIHDRELCDVGQNHEYTFSFWVYSDAVESGSEIIFSTRADPQSPGFQIGFVGDWRQLTLELADDQGHGASVTGTTAIRGDNQWHHVAVTFSAGSAYLYVDGKRGTLVDIRGYGALPASGEPRFGTNFVGLVDEVILLGHSASEQERQTLMSNAEEAPSRYIDLFHHLELTEGVAVTGVDFGMRRTEEPPAQKLVKFALAAFDVDGNRVDTVEVGERFEVVVMVEDQRKDPSPAHHAF